MTKSSALKLRLQIYCGEEIAMGPGKADLLEAIAAHGSISAAARVLAMSYRRAWLLVDTMNRCWTGPLVEAVAGGGQERGARVTPLGEDVLRRYREALSAATVQAGEALEGGLTGLLETRPRPSRH